MDENRRTVRPAKAHDAGFHRNGLTRRRFVQGTVVTGLGVIAGCGLGRCQAQQPVLRRIGYLSEVTFASLPIDAFRQSLQDLGYIEGQNLAVEYRSAEGHADRLPGLAAELAQLRVEVIAAAGGPAVLAARNVTPSIPVVMCIVGTDPVALGLIASLARPGGHVTGVTNNVGMAVPTKRLELLRQAVPKQLASVGLYNER